MASGSAWWTSLTRRLHPERTSARLRTLRRFRPLPSQARTSPGCPSRCRRFLIMQMVVPLLSADQPTNRGDLRAQGVSLPAGTPGTKLDVRMKCTADRPLPRPRCRSYSVSTGTSALRSRIMPRHPARVTPSSTQASSTRHPCGRPIRSISRVYRLLTSSAPGFTSAQPIDILGMIGFGRSRCNRTAGLLATG